MKIVKYVGGLGNQMFIYAFSIALRETFKQEIYADTHYYKSFKFHNGLEISRVFGVTLKEAKVWDILRLAWYFPNYWIDFQILSRLPKRKTTQKELPRYQFNDRIMEDASEKYYDGYWQNYKYFNKYKSIITKEFQFKNPLPKQNQELLNEISGEPDSVAVHVRRGDYLKNKKYVGLCGLDYYKAAIEIIGRKVQKPVFYLFSDDIEYVKNNICPLLDGAAYKIVSWNKGDESYVDMQLMSKCSHMIIANSSFSWWAAYLNERVSNVIAPQKWTNSDILFKFQLDEWITI